MQKRIFGYNGPMISVLGFGLHGMSEFYGATDDVDGIQII